MLKKVLQAGSAVPSMIAVSRLEEFFNESLSRDNFDGLAHLVSYLETNNIDISGWNLQRFRSALNFYLNHQFNMNKILTFVRFYVHHAKGAIDKENTSQSVQSDQELLQQFDRVFGNLENLVDMNEVFSHLVEKVGSRKFIDPVTKEDPLVNLIDFYSRPDVQQLSNLSNEGTTSISSAEVSKYLLNHITEQKAFERAANLIKRYDAGPNGNNVLVMSLLQGLNSHVVKHGSLPQSFSDSSIRNFYL